MAGMNRFMKVCVSFIFFFLTAFLNCGAQATVRQKEKTTPAEIERYKQEAGRLVSFLEYSMNIVGSDSSTVEEKESVIYFSYLKIYKDKKVLIEDDLDENRQVPVYKAVQSYLQDIAYFYKKVQFSMEVENIEFLESESHVSFLKITASRHLKGIGLYNDTIENTQRRYIEMNIDSKNKEVKVVSMYTTKPDEKGELVSWWNQLPEEWKVVFKKATGIADSVQYEQIKRMTAIETVDLSDNKSITDFSPLSRLTELKQIDLSGTVISDLNIIRNLIQLEVLKVDGTQLLVIPPLRYLHKLSSLNISNTGISTLEGVQYFPNLRRLYCAGTLISDFSPLAEIKYLEELDCSGTGMKDLSSLSICTNLTRLDVSDTKVESLMPLSTLFNLRNLNLSNTMVTDIQPLQSLRKLMQLSFNNTWVTNLKPLLGITTLKTIYCDNTRIHKEETAEFVQKHKNTLVIYESEGLVKWWSSMNGEWKKVFRQGRQMDDIPSKEQLAILTSIDSINISSNPKISDLIPLKAITNLKVLNLSFTHVESLNPIADIASLQKLVISGTGIKKLDDLAKLNRLSLLICNNTQIDSLTLADFINSRKNCLVIYKSGELIKWWDQLNVQWKAIFRGNIRLDSPPSEIQLHRLANLDSINLSGQNIGSIEPLHEFLYLRYLGLSKCAFNFLPNLKTFRQLTVLDISDNPLPDLNSVTENRSLLKLNCSNTAIRDLTPIQKIPRLEVLQCAGTRVKNIEPLADFFNLDYLDISNTQVRKIGSLDNLNKLKTLVCYNTLISKKTIESFKIKHPKCDLNHF